MKFLIRWHLIASLSLLSKGSKGTKKWSANCLDLVSSVTEKVFDVDRKLFGVRLTMFFQMSRGFSSAQKKIAQMLKCEFHFSVWELCQSFCTCSTNYICLRLQIVQLNTYNVRRAFAEKKFKNSKKYSHIISHITYPLHHHGRSEKWLNALADLGGAWGTHAPPWASKFFRFHAVFGKIWRVHAPLEGSRPPLGKILDPPLKWFG